MSESFQVPPLFDYAATVAWALSGAVVGIRKRFDITGVFVIALLSATGGGLMRDAFLLRVPAFLTKPVYLPLIAGTTLVVALFTRLLTGKMKGRTVSKLVDVIDALGMPAFAVIGMQLAEERGIPIAGVVFVGVVNGLGGGLLRDVVVRDVPTLLRPGQFVS
ncbi:MAG: trimeric intracellular cation channel family protein, partial [Candidatus Eiseniibacteriota bacterium]